MYALSPHSHQGMRFRDSSGLWTMHAVLYIPKSLHTVYRVFPPRSYIL